MLNELASYIAKARWSPTAEAMAARDIENGFKLAITNVTDHWQSQFKPDEIGLMMVSHFCTAIAASFR